MPRYENRAQLALALVVGLLLLANLFTLTLVALAPAERASRAPILFTVFIITLVVSVPCIVLLPRWLLRPYRQLLGEAERAPVTARADGVQDEAEFVLETFQAVVAQLRTQQRELENLNARASARAATAEKFSEHIIASVPSGLVAFDAQGRATVVNAPACTLLETNGEAEGQSIRNLLHSAPTLADMIEQCLRTGEVYRREEVTMTNAENQTRRLGATIAPIDLRREGGAFGAICLLTDITEVSQLREALALKRNLESLGEMSAGLAHEFKNTLATLHGYAQFLQNLETDERGRNAASALLQEVRSLTEMVTSFLNFARPQPLELAYVSLFELLEDCQAELRTLYEERHVSLDIEGDFATIRADERMLRQALLNLLRNAAEAIGDEQANRRVHVYGKSEHDNSSSQWAVIQIADTGTGIEAKDMQRVFIPFFTTKSKGHGVGLALAYRVITQHGGTLIVNNASEGGAIFTIRLPV